MNQGKLNPKSTFPPSSQPFFTKMLLTPGQTITAEQGFLRGHGSYLEENDDNGENGGTMVLKSCIAGEVERVNRLISVKPLNCRYAGEIGDLVVGRIVMVDSKRWKVDICGQKEAILQLASITLPGGVQRMRTYEDQLQMRTLFEEGDLLCAEIQNVSSEGVVSIHSRSMKYGKLENGQLVVVPAVLIRRLPQHYITLSCGMDIILGKNGYIWISRTIPEEWRVQEGDLDDMTPLAEAIEKLKVRHRNTPLTIEERKKAARLSNSVRALATMKVPITGESTMAVYQRSIDLKFEPKDLLVPANVELVTRPF